MVFCKGANRSSLLHSFLLIYLYRLLLPGKMQVVKRTQPHPDGESSVPWSGKFVLATASTFGVFFSHQTLIVLTPYYVAVSGSGDAATGLVTGVFMLAATVTPLGMSRLLSRFDTRSLLVVSVLLMAAPTLAYPLTSSPMVVAALSLIRGVGFGIAAVGCATAVSVLTPLEKHSAAVGWFGLAASSPGILGPSFGLSLVSMAGFGWTFVLMGLLTLVTLAVILPLGSMPPIPASGAGSGISWALRRGSLVLPSLMFAAAALVYGGLLTFVPPYLDEQISGSASVFFLILGSAIALSRYTGGTALERFGAVLVFPASLGASAAGVLLLGLAPFSAAPFVAALLFGTGFGTVATATHATLVSRVNREGYGTANSLFNVAFNGGIGAGGALFGVVAHAIGYAFTFLSATIWLAAGMVFFAYDRGSQKKEEDVATDVTEGTRNIGGGL